MKRNTQKHRHHVRLIVSVFAERDGKFVFIEEQRKRRQLSEPVGHIDAGEGVLAAAAREFLEETGFRVVLRSLIGVYYNHYSRGPISDSIRFAFFGRAARRRTAGGEPTIRLHWVGRDKLDATVKQLSHPTSRRALADFLRGQKFPLSVIRDLRL